MNHDERDLLAARYLAGDLDDAGKRTLLEELRTDPEFARDVSSHVLTDRLLSLEEGGPDAATFHRELRQRLTLPETGADFTRDIVGRVMAEGAPPRRRSGLKLLRGRRASSPWIPAVVAASLLVGFVALLGVSVSTPKPSGTRQADLPEAPPKAKLRRVATGSATSREEDVAPMPPSSRPPQPGVNRPRPTKLPTAPNGALPGLAIRPKTNRSVPSPPKVEPPTRATGARIVEAVRAFILPDGTDLEAGATVRAGQGIGTGDEGRAVLVFPDSTQVELGPHSRVNELALLPAKRLRVEIGQVTARVSPQKSGRAFVIATPHADAQVLGTVLTVQVEDASTRLTVTEGRVRFTRRTDRRVVVVAAGHQAVAAPGLKLVSRPVRSRRALEALYFFDETSGNVRDHSGGNLPLSISRAGNVRRTAEGLHVELPVRISSGPAAHLVNSVRRSGAFSVEVWVKPEDVRQTGPARIISLGSRKAVCFMVGMNGNVDLNEAPLRNYVVRVRTTETNPDGTQGDPRKWIPVLSSPADTAVPRWTHLVFTRNADGEAALFINGVVRARTVIAGDLGLWDPSVSVLTLVNEVAQDRPWLGLLGGAALYSRAVAAEEVVRRFRAGPRGLR